MIGIVPLVSMVSPLRWAMMSKVTDFVLPRSVRSPVAFVVTFTPFAGTLPSSIGLRQLERRGRERRGVHDPALELAVAVALVARHLGEVRGEGRRVRPSCR